MESKNNLLYDCPPGTSSFIPEKLSYSCFICTKIVYMHDVLRCPQCLIKAHKQCIVNDEPMWQMKLDVNSWVCRSCRKFYCSQCLKTVTGKSEFISCVTCKVGMHYNCFNSLVDKPLQKIQDKDSYVCIPCANFATQKSEEENENEIEHKEITKGKKNVIVQNESEEEKDHVNSSSEEELMDLGDHGKESTEVSNEKIPDVTGWNKYKLHKYLSKRLPKEVLDSLLTHEIDGSALRLLQREDITSLMDLKLGDAMKLYKEVRILQTQRTFFSHYWE